MTSRYIQKYNIQSKNIAFIGDDVNDIKLILVNDQEKKEDIETFIDSNRQLQLTPRKGEITAREGEKNARDGATSRRKSTRVKKLSIIDEFSLPNETPQKRRYVSRRGKIYDDSDSEGDADPNNPRFLDTGVIKYRDTLGKVYRIEPNPRFIRYKNAFTNLMK